MKVQETFKVTFNMEIGQYEIGEREMNTIDFVGDDIDELAKEVIASDPNYPMKFIPLCEGQIIGVFVDADDEECVAAVMFK